MADGRNLHPGWLMLLAHIHPNVKLYNHTTY
jgi:hypothetical protein